MSEVNQQNLVKSASDLPVTQDVAGSSPVRPATLHKWHPLEPEGFPIFEPEGFFVSSLPCFLYQGLPFRRRKTGLSFVIATIAASTRNIEETSSV